MNIRLILAAAALMAALPQSAVPAGEDPPCGESGLVEVADVLSIKQILGTFLEDGTPQLTLHFDIPTTLKDAALGEVFVGVIGSEDQMHFTTPLKTWVMEDGLEGMLIATEPRVRDYSVWASYTPGEGKSGCGFVTRLKLAGNPHIDDRLACLQKSTWTECNFPGLLERAAARD